jgi:hypothetical protein
VKRIVTLFQVLNNFSTLFADSEEEGSYEEETLDTPASDEKGNAQQQQWGYR